MNKKIKIIDLLNKIANGEEETLPKRIKLDNHKLEYIGKWQQYIGQDNNSLSLLSIINDYNYSGLNDEVEILEDNIEEIEELYEFTDINHYDPCSIEANRKTINKLIREVGKLRKELNK